MATASPTKDDEPPKLDENTWERRPDDTKARFGDRASTYDNGSPHGTPAIATDARLPHPEDRVPTTKIGIETEPIQTETETETWTVTVIVTIRSETSETGTELEGIDAPSFSAARTVKAVLRNLLLS